MKKTENLRGELTDNQREELRDLMIKFKKANEGHAHKVLLKDLKMLEGEDGKKMWKYFDHIARLVCMYKNHRNTLRNIAIGLKIQMSELVEEAVMNEIIWMYRYGWRQLDTTQEKFERYLFDAAHWGFVDWIPPLINEAQLAYETGKPLLDLPAEPEDGGKVCNKN